MNSEQYICSCQKNEFFVSSHDLVDVEYVVLGCSEYAVREMKMVSLGSGFA